MANIKISELEELTIVADDDVLPIVDVSENETKKVNKSNIIAGLIKENTDAVLTNVVSRNIYRPELNLNWPKSLCSVVLINDEYVFTATGTDIYLGQVTAKDTNYDESKGELLEVVGGKTLTIVPSNSQFNSIYVTAYDSNKKSLGYNKLSSSSTIYQIPDTAKFVTIRFGVNPATAGTTYKTKLLVTYAEETTYTPYLNLQELQENNIDTGWLRFDSYGSYRKLGKLVTIRVYANGLSINLAVNETVKLGDLPAEFIPSTLIEVPIPVVLLGGTYNMQCTLRINNTTGAVEIVNRSTSSITAIYGLRIFYTFPVG